MEEVKKRRRRRKAGARTTVAMEIPTTPRKQSGGENGGSSPVPLLSLELIGKKAKGKKKTSRRRTKTEPESDQEDSDLSPAASSSSSSNQRVSVSKSQDIGSSQTCREGDGPRYTRMDTIESNQRNTIYRCFDHVTSQFVAVKEEKAKHAIHATPRGFHECTIVQYVNDVTNLQQDPGSRFVLGFVDQYYSVSKDTYYLVTPFYIRGSLLDYTISDRGFGAYARTIKDIGRDILFGIRYLHSIGVAHRDIKPDNIFIHYDSGLGRESARIGDFGLALIVDENGPVINENPGTVFYAAPEVFDGLETNDPRPGDIWSFGSTLFSAIYGWYPFVHEDEEVSYYMPEAEVAKLNKNIAERTRLHKSNHLIFKLPKEFEPEVLEVFSLCFVERDSRVSAEELLECAWFSSIPSADNVLSFSCCRTEEALSVGDFYRLNGFDPKKAESNPFASETTPCKKTFEENKSKTNARFRLTNGISMFSFRGKK